MNINGNNNKEGKIREIAYSIYLENKRRGIENNSENNWLRAESIYNNKIKYYWWILRRHEPQISLCVALFSLILSIIAILPYALEIGFNIYYRPELTLTFNCKNMLQDKNGDWLADYNLSIGTSRNFLILPKDVFVSYNDRTIVPNERPDAPGGIYSTPPAMNAISSSWRWCLDNSLVKHSSKHNLQIGLFARARLKEKRNILPTQIVIYAEVEPDNIGFWKLFYHSRRYKGVVNYGIDFSGKSDQEEIRVRLQ